MKISLFPPLSISEIGRRSNQEDSIAQWGNRLFVLCDGMGGHEKGEVASQTVCQALVKWFEQNIKDDSFSDGQLREAIEYAYQQLDQYADGSPKQMGTTLTLLYIHCQGVTAAHIGDSRIYHIRVSSPMGGGQEGAILYQSRDHSLVFDLFQAGEITYDEMITYPQKNIVTRAMTPGKDNRHRPDIIHITDVQPSDYFYLCSDGMLEQTTNDELLSLLSDDVPDEEKQRKLIVVTANNQDNHSAWLVHIKDVIKEEGEDQLVNEESTARSNALNIMPRQNDDDVHVVDDDDVVMVSTPKPLKRKLPWRKMVIAALAFLLALVAVWLITMHDSKPELKRPKPMMQVPIRPIRQHKDSLKDTNRIQNHDSTGNQQPINALRRNDSTRHL